MACNILATACITFVVLRVYEQAWIWHSLVPLLCAQRVSWPGLYRHMLAVGR